MNARGGSRRWPWLVAALLGTAAGPAEATSELYFVDPTRSTLTLETADSFLTFDFGLPFGPRVVPLQSQVGRGGSGASLPDGTTSDGLRTFLEGTLLVDLTPTTIAVIGRRSGVTPGESGSFLPGEPSGAASAAPAELAAFFSDPTLGIEGSAAVRDSFVTYGLAPKPLRDLGGGTLGFEAGDGSVFALIAGVLDFDTNFVGIEGRAGLDFFSGTGAPGGSTGLLADIAGGFQEISIPFDVTVLLEDDLFGAGIPVSAQLRFTGQIVANNVPEPGSGLLLASAVLALAAARGRQRRG